MERETYRRLMRNADKKVERAEAGEAKRRAKSEREDLIKTQRRHNDPNRKKY